MNIYNPVQLAFIQFISCALKKSIKTYGYLNLTNKEIAERFVFKGKKFSHRYIESLIPLIKNEFNVITKGSTRYILQKNVTCQTRLSYMSDTIEIRESTASVTCQTRKPGPEFLEPQGIQDPLLINNINIKNQELIINKEKEKNKKEKEKQIPAREGSASADVYVLPVRKEKSEEENKPSPLDEAIQEFTQFRKKIKAPLTDRALQLLYKELDKLASSDEEKIKILEQSILHGWKGVFPLKQQDVFETKEARSRREQEEAEERERKRRRTEAEKRRYIDLGLLEETDNRVANGFERMTG